MSSWMFTCTGGPRHGFPLLLFSVHVQAKRITFSVSGGGDHEGMAQH